MIVEQQLNTELVLINNWFQTNLLSLNVTKTSFIIFGRKKNLTANIYINNVLIQRQHDTKFLGVILSADLKWDKHIDIVTNKVSKSIGIIAKARHLLPQHLTRTLYLTLVDPYVSYCNLVWSLSHATMKLDRIHKLQKKYCRLITFPTLRPLLDLCFNVFQYYLFMINTNTNCLFTYINAHIISSRITTPVNITLKTQAFINAILVSRTISIFQNAEPVLDKILLFIKAQHFGMHYQTE